MDKLKYKKRYKYPAIGILIAVIMIFSIYLINILGESTEPNIIKSFMDMKPKKEIFTYLKVVQPLEDRFYKLVNQNVDFVNNPNPNREEYLSFLDENKTVIDELLLNLSKIDGNSQMAENKQLFLDEMKIMKDIMTEETLYLEKKDAKGFIRANEYLKKYIVISQVRREALKKVFDKYDIIYIDLGDRIKYKTK